MFNNLLSFRDTIVLALLTHLACFTTQISPALATHISSMQRLLFRNIRALLGLFCTYLLEEARTVDLQSLGPSSAT